MRSNMTEAIVLNKIHGSSGFNVSRRKMANLSDESLIQSFKGLTDYDQAEIMRKMQGTFTIAGLRQHMVNWLTRYGSLF